MSLCTQRAYLRGVGQQSSSRQRSAAGRRHGGVVSSASTAVLPASLCTWRVHALPLPPTAQRQRGPSVQATALATPFPSPPSTPRPLTFPCQRLPPRTAPAWRPAQCTGRRRCLPCARQCCRKGGSRVAVTQGRARSHEMRAWAAPLYGGGAVKERCSYARTHARMPHAGQCPATTTNASHR